MALEVPEYTSKELSPKTWPDLARLFEKPEIGDAWVLVHIPSSVLFLDGREPATAYKG